MHQSIPAVPIPPPPPRADPRELAFFENELANAPAHSAHYFLEEKFSAFNPVLRHVDFPSHAVEFGTSSTNIIKTYLGQY